MKKRCSFNDIKHYHCYNKPRYRFLSWGPHPEKVEGFACEFHSKVLWSPWDGGDYGLRRVRLHR